MADPKILALQDVLMKLTPLPVLAAGLVGTLRFRQLPLNLRYLTGLIGLVLPLEILALVLLLQKRNNLFIIPIYTLVELWGLALVYRQTLQSATYTRLMPWLVGGFATYALLDSLVLVEASIFRPGQQVVQAILVLSLVGLYFRKLLHDLNVPHLRQEPMFWVSAGLLVYFLGYLQIALFSNYLLHYSKQLNMTVWAVHSLLFMLLYGCYCRALWLTPPK